MKPWLAPAIILSLLAAVASGAQYYGDHRYVMQDTYKQAVQQQRIWQLMDKIQEAKDRAIGRQLTPAEQRQIERWESEIKKLEARG